MIDTEEETRAVHVAHWKERVPDIQSGRLAKEQPSWLDDAARGGMHRWAEGCIRVRECPKDHSGSIYYFFLFFCRRVSAVHK